MTTPSTVTSNRLLWSLALVWLGVAGRALVDKLLALRGAGELVAAQAQLSNVVDLVAGVSMSGLGVGVTALIAQAAAAERPALLRAAVGLSALTSGAFALLVLGIWLLSPWPIVPTAYHGLVPWVVLNGVLAVAAGIWTAALVGEGRLRLAFALTLAGVALQVLALLATPGSSGWQTLAALTGAQTLFCAVVGAWVLSGRAAGTHRTAAHAQAQDAGAPPAPARQALSPEQRAQLLRFVPAGLSIGLLSPLSLAVSRLAMAEHLSWDAAGQVQALWRTTEWITVTVSGVLGYHVLPRLSQASRQADAFSRELHHWLRWAVLPACAALALAWAALPLLQGLLYTAQMALPRALALPYILGDAVRLVSWVYLYALYARADGRAIAVGELLSLPLFAALLVLLGPRMSIEAIGWAWAGSFAAYAVFNWAAAKAQSARGR